MVRHSDSHHSGGFAREEDSRSWNSAVLLVGVSGCGSSADSLMKDQIKQLNDLADALRRMTRTRPGN